MNEYDLDPIVLADYFKQLGTKNAGLTYCANDCPIANYIGTHEHHANIAVNQVEIGIGDDWYRTGPFLQQLITTIDRRYPGRVVELSGYDVYDIIVHMPWAYE